MALLGSLSEFHVDDVLTLLATTGKTGVLVVDGGRHPGRIWVDGGHIVGGEFGADTETAAVTFELLRLSDGKFAFEVGAAPATLGAPQDVVSVVAQAKARLAEWRDIERVVPSMASVVALDPAGGDGDSLITITAEDWRTLAAVGGGGPVTDLARRLELNEFAACKAVKSLVGAGLATVTPVAG